MRERGVWKVKFVRGGNAEQNSKENTKLKAGENVENEATFKNPAVSEFLAKEKLSYILLNSCL